MTDKYARVWSGTEWVNVSSPIASPNAVAVYQPTAPSSPVTGQIWVDSDDNASYVWNGSSWGASPNLSLYAPIASPTFTGTTTFPTLSLTTSDTATAATHYMVETAMDGIVRPKTLANTRAEIVTTAAVNSAAATTVGTITSGVWNAGAVTSSGGISGTTGSFSSNLSAGLQVNQSASSTDVTNYYSGVRNMLRNTSATVGNFAGIGFNSAGGSDVAAVHAIFTAHTAGTSSGHLVFSTSNLSPAPTERLRITSSGNVGIGTNSPAAKLDVNGNAIFRGGNGEGGEVALTNPDGSAYGLIVDVSSANSGRIFQTLNDSVLQIGQLAGTNGVVQFYTQATERMRISAAGNIGIGITNPVNYKLEVAGIVEADNYDIGLTTLASDSIAINFSGETGLYTRTAVGNIIFTASSYRAGSIKTVRIIPGAALRTLTFPAAWVFVGAKPASVAASKVGILTITSFGTTEADCVAAWAVQA